MNTRRLKKFVLEKINTELSDKHTYHGVNHTKHVLKVCNKYIKRMKIPAHDAYLLRTAALMHDFGFIKTYENHEEESIMYVKQVLPEWDYSEKDVDIIAGMINATIIPQKPKTELEQILGDADLDYLGTDAFYAIGQKLYNELLAFNKITNEEEWNRLQISFLQNHHFHTPFAKKHREPVKQKYLKELIEKWGNK